MVPASISSLQDHNGFGLTFTWEPSSRPDAWRLTRARDSAGREVQFTYNAAGFLQSASVLGLAASYQYEGEESAPGHHQHRSHGNLQDTIPAIRSRAASSSQKVRSGQPARGPVAQPAKAAQASATTLHRTGPPASSAAPAAPRPAMRSVAPSAPVSARAGTCWDRARRGARQTIARRRRSDRICNDAWIGRGAGSEVNARAHCSRCAQDIQNGCGFWCRR